MSSREICLSWDYCEIQARVSFPAFQSRRVVWSTKRGLRSKQKIFQSCFWRPSKLWQPRLWLIQMDRFAFRIHYERAAPMLFATLLLCQRFASQSTTLLSNNMLNSKVIAILESNSNYNHVSKYITPYQTTGLINCWGLWWVMSWWRCRSKRNLEIWMTPFPLCLFFFST